MRQKFKSVIAGLCALSITVPVFAVDSSQSVAQLAKQLASLQQQVNSLQAQLHAKNQQDQAAARQARHASRQRSSAAAQPVDASAQYNENKNVPISGISTLPTSGTTYIPVDVDVPGQSFVSSGPYIGVPLQFSGSNLIVNTPSVNQDVALLKVRKNIHERLQALGVIEEPDHAHVLLSGEVEGQAFYQDIGGGPNSTDIDLTNVTLDTYILGPSEWLSSLISFTYDNNSGPSDGTFANNSTVLNSRVYVNQGFFTIGNFSKTPFYGTVGQYYVPFGTYASNMVTGPLTKSMARIKARAILVGYQPQVDNTPYASAYIFQGDSHAGATSRVNNGGINLGYRFTHAKFSGDIGGGVIGNIADSVGMQFVSNGTAIFNGFGGVNGTGNERIAHRVPAYDIRALLDFGTKIDFIGEFITASTAFNKNDLTMNNHGARPKALNAELSYSFQAFARPTALAVGYGMTKDAMALQLPAQRYSVTAFTSIWKDTLQSLEFRHDVHYAKSSFATGSNIPAPQSSGQCDSTVTAQFDVFF
ncbi:MAG TPA: LbtU family siderophore porin [Gammaproteobacteria bacterium]|nr:LbtU family siderophore porin [Gammaproteobacteria bacterium]